MFTNNRQGYIAINNRPYTTLAVGFRWFMDHKSLVYCGLFITYSPGGQGFLAVVNKPCPRAMPSDSVCLLPYIPGHLGYNYNINFPSLVRLLCVCVYCMCIYTYIFVCPFVVDLQSNSLNWA